MPEKDRQSCNPSLVHLLIIYQTLYKLSACAILRFPSFTTPSERSFAPELTNAHDHKEARQEPPKVHHPAPRALHEVIGVGCAPADVVRKRCDYVGCDDQQREVLIKEGGAEDYEEKAYR